MEIERYCPWQNIEVSKCFTFIDGPFCRNCIYSQSQMNLCEYSFIREVKQKLVFVKEQPNSIHWFSHCHKILLKFSPKFCCILIFVSICSSSQDLWYGPSMPIKEMLKLKQYNWLALQYRVLGFHSIIIFHSSCRNQQERTKN